ncbi:hypothetical protein ACV242_001000 [Peribacillus simplex]
MALTGQDSSIEVILIIMLNLNTLAAILFGGFLLLIKKVIKNIIFFVTKLP